MTPGGVGPTGPAPFRQSLAERARPDTAGGRPPCVVLTIRATDHPERWMAAARAAINQLRTRPHTSESPPGDPAVAYLVILPATTPHPPPEPHHPTTALSLRSNAGRLPSSNATT